MKDQARNSTVEDLAARARNHVDATADKVDDTIDDYADRFADLEQQLRQAGDRLVENAKVLSAEASRHTRSHPLAAIGIAFAAGLVVSKLLRR
ncbi:MAG: hypothetical protein ABI846_08040 [Rudaea sp.]